MCAGDGFDECGFSVIYVTCCADDSHGFNLTTLCGQSEKTLGISPASPGLLSGYFFAAGVFFPCPMMRW